MVRETRTNTPLQALNLMNDETYTEAASALAAKMKVSSDPVAEGFRRVLARAPQPKEAQVLQAAYSRFQDWTPVASMILNLDEAVTKP
jgi:hypothetical protein